MDQAQVRNLKYQGLEKAWPPDHCEGQELVLENPFRSHQFDCNYAAALAVTQHMQNSIIDARRTRFNPFSLSPRRASSSFRIIAPMRRSEREFGPTGVSAWAVSVWLERVPHSQNRNGGSPEPGKSRFTHPGWASAGMDGEAFFGRTCASKLSGRFRQLASRGGEHSPSQRGGGERAELGP